VTGASEVSAGGELGSRGTLDSVADEPDSEEELEPDEEAPDSPPGDDDPEEAEPDSAPDEDDPDGATPDSLPGEPDPDAEELDSPAELEPASEPLDPGSPVEGEDSCPEDPSVAEEDPLLDWGACAGALSVEEPVEAPLAARAARVARWASPEAVARVSFSVLPGKAPAATAVNTPVSVALPAISQRLARLSRRRAASREREVWLGLTAIERGTASSRRRHRRVRRRRIRVEAESECAVGTQAVAKEGVRSSIRAAHGRRKEPTHPYPWAL
jgi:hypothetical protein